MHKSLSILCCLLLVACDNPPATAEDIPPTISEQPVTTRAQLNSTFNLTEIAEGVFVHHGVHATVDDPQHDDIANIGFIVGDECVAVIDTGGSIAIGQALRAAIKNRTEKPICYVINTHVHFDHVLGNAAFKTDHPSFVGHRDLQEAMLQNGEFFVENFAADLQEGDRAASVDQVIGPDQLVEGSLTLDLGNRALVLTAHPRAHTDTDLTVFDEKTKTLWLSDLLFMERIPILAGSIKGWNKELEKLTVHPADRVVPGHGPISADWPQASVDEQRYFNVLIPETREAIAKGDFLGDAIKTVGQSEKDNWLFFDDYHQGNVSRTFTELEWE